VLCCYSSCHENSNCDEPETDLMSVGSLSVTRSSLAILQDHCNSLDPKCSPKVHVLKAWSMAGSIGR
jgi:hypothetical protein